MDGVEGEVVNIYLTTLIADLIIQYMDVHT